MAGAPDAAPAKPKPGWARRWRWPLRAALALGLLELLARQYVARPNRILRHSDDAEMVYENTPGTWLGHAKFDIWHAPIYMVLDLINLGPGEHKGPAPLGYTVYRIDDNGCRVPPEGPGIPTADVILLGSSQAFGLFVPEEDTVRAMLERSLGERGFQGVRVANCGVIGHHFIQSLRTAELVQKPKRPRLFVTLVRPWHMREQYDYTKTLYPENPVVGALTRASSLARAIYYVTRREPDQFNKPMILGAPLQEKLDIYTKAMNEDGTRSLFILLEDKQSDCSMYDELEAELKKRGLGVERVVTPTSPKDLFVDHDQHWSAKGSAVTTAQLLDFVVREMKVVQATPATPAKPAP
jgi:hypothetical protein